MVAKYLIITGSSILLILGIFHLFFVFFTENFLPRNAATLHNMNTDSPVLTDETTVWKAWLGFNASHSSGIIFMALINLLIANQYFDLFLKSGWFLILDNMACLFYLYLAKKYWFTVPFRGVAIVTLCFIIATILILF
jgi:hypothetical protein